MRLFVLAIALALSGGLAAVSCAPAPDPSTSSLTVFQGGNLVNLDGSLTGDAILVVEDGRIVHAGASDGSPLPVGAELIDLAGAYVIPGLISAHSHVSAVDGMRPPAYTETNTRRQLSVFARYGVTTVWSLGGEQAPAFRLRDGQNVQTLSHSRLYVAGDVISADTPEAARAEVTRVARSSPDVIKIRVDDNLGNSTKMPPEVYRAVIEEAHGLGLRVAAHVFYLDDAKDLVRAGADVIAHSVRDVEIDDEFIELMKERSIPYCPTLTRELSTFVYETTPAFLSDPFFLREADPEVILSLAEPARQATFASSASAQAYKAALPVAQRNLKRAADAGVLIAMGTDSGPLPERFQGYFEHLELEIMADSGLTPLQILQAATVDAARAMQLDDVGSLEPGAWADFVALERDPREDIRNTRTISSVWIAGNRVPDRPDR